jgi:hypothetical protein
MWSSTERLTAAVLSVVPILNVSDVRASLAWFEQLGWETRFIWEGDSVDEPGFAAGVPPPPSNGHAFRIGSGLGT